MGIAVMCMPEGEEGSVCIGSAAKEEKGRRKRKKKKEEEKEVIHIASVRFNMYILIEPL